MMSPEKLRMLNLLFSALLPTAAIIVLGMYEHLRWKKFNQQQIDAQAHWQQINLQRQEIQQLLKAQEKEQYEGRQRFDQHQIHSLTVIQDSLQKGLQEVRVQISNNLNQYAEHLGKRMDDLTQEVQRRLKEISGEVDRQLTSGFEKTTATFSDVMKRLTIIDEAQKKITELSSNVVNLQEILADKRSRGAFGEVQLATLIRNVIPETHFSLQHTLTNGKRVDCLLILPPPSGNIAIDAKFPLESYQHMTKVGAAAAAKLQAEQQFRQDIRKHIEDIAEKYIAPPETTEGAVMFIPAEAIFAEIHAHYPDLVELAHRRKVWLVSPTTMMAVLTTARAVLKDAATRKQVHLIQQHLTLLSKDFSRFEERMDHLAKHINQAQQDVEQVHQSSKKITSRFSKIEKVELQESLESVTLSTESLL
jgi:DNA recombination protein RmuC